MDIVERLMDIQGRLENLKLNLKIEYLNNWVTQTEPMLRLTVYHGTIKAETIIPYSKLLAAIDPEEMVIVYVKSLIKGVELKL